MATGSSNSTWRAIATKKSATKPKKVAKKAEAKKAAPAQAATKKAAKKKKKKAKKDAVPVLGPRMKIVWAVCDHGLKVLKVYPYPERAAAEAEAARLMDSKGKEHIVRKETVPME